MDAGETPEQGRRQRRRQQVIGAAAVLTAMGLGYLASRQSADESDTALCSPIRRVLLGRLSERTVAWASEAEASSGVVEQVAASRVRQRTNVSASEQARIQRIYREFASTATQQGGAVVMNQEDFLRSLSAVMDANTGEVVDFIELKNRRAFEKLFDLADTDGLGYLSAEQYEDLHASVISSDNEYQAAFQLFDRDGDDQIDFAEFVKMIEHIDDSEVPFDFDSEWLMPFFGADRTTKLSYPAFTQMLKGLRWEKARQEFLFYDRRRCGRIKVADFVRISQRIARKRFPEAFAARLSELGSLDPSHPGEVSFAQFLAFQSFVLHFPSYLRVLLYACDYLGTKSVNKPTFLKYAQPPATSIEISPLEVDLLFLWFAELNGELYPRSLKAVLDDHSSSSSHHVSTVSSLSSSSSPSSSPSSSSSSSSLSSPQAGASEKRALGHLLDGLANFGLGAIAGGVGATAVYPIDLVKTRMQAQVSSKGAVLLYKNSWDCARKVLAREGPRAFYRGLVPQLVGVAPEKAIKLTVNDYLRRLFGRAAPNPEGKMYLPLEILAGGGAGASQVIFTNPLEIVKIRLQMQGEGGVVRRGAMDVVRELGLAGLYKGSSACFLRDIPFSMIYFPTFAGLKDYFAQQNEDGKIRETQILLAGTMAGAPSAGLCTPADVIKTRLQLEAKAGTHQYNGIRDCFWKVLEREGPRAFWKGAMARMFRSSPQFGVTLLTYEKLQQLFFPNVELRPPTNAPVTHRELQQNQMLRAVSQVENKWSLSN